VPVLDRGFIFGDGVYEVIPVYRGAFFRLDEHLARLQNSLDGIRLPNPYTATQWHTLFAELLKRNAPAAQQTVYVQVTRGVAPRDLAFPAVPPTVFAMVQDVASPTAAARARGITAITVADIRWQRCHIKAITLLPNVLMRQQALDAGVQEAILVRDGEALEGVASNLFIVRDGRLITPPKGQHLLPGITRDVVLGLAQDIGLTPNEHAIPLKELQGAEEIWLTSSNKEIQAVTWLDGKQVGNGTPGPWWARMTARYDAFKMTLG